MISISTKPVYFSIAVNGKARDLKPCSVEFLQQFSSIDSNNLAVIDDMLFEIINNCKQTDGKLGFLNKISKKKIENISPVAKAEIIKTYFEWVMSFKKKL